MSGIASYPNGARFFFLYDLSEDIFYHNPDTLQLPAHRMRLRYLLSLLRYLILRFQPTKVMRFLKGESNVFLSFRLRSLGILFIGYVMILQ
ncbi:hypothetical protein LEP1GSC193_0415 [Leptospira alstonii serovar Pingchang str. 80-412]|uniref:Uncharacterized protein n=1 Tax=Leptospira alstonii serovar Pingchang str. 80-412 TaxID=1218564 RepID=T0G7M7_9LEPT|nr:hypothetical protein LEP1GSC193_0415 [Leptospira alstonii serovar Pingchang str. 80-412]